jgi:hypothetical protein
MLPVLETILSGFGSHPAVKRDAEEKPGFFYDRQLDDIK